jgi:predicted chitinase
MNLKPFFDHTRPVFFPTGLKQDQVNNINLILDECRLAGITDLRWLAYILATVYHETAGEMRPIEEYGKGAKRPYGIPDPQTGHAYYGRGFSQLTGRDNYDLFGRRLGIDLLRKPELALQAAYSAKILVLGMSKGLFTGKSLADYFAGSEGDWINARRIVNGSDRAQLIANYAHIFHQGFELAQAIDAGDTDASPAIIEANKPATPSITTMPKASSPESTVINPYETDVVSKLRPEWWQRLLTSKINWSIIVTAGVHIAILFGAQLTPEQEADITRLIYSVEGMVVLILRTFFNNPK